MTHRAISLFCVAAVGWLLAGCTTTYVPFTHELRSRHDLSRADLERLQYYVSHDVKLRREAQTIGRDISAGNLKLIEGKTIEEVVIEQHTPGVAVAVNDNAITISFAEGSELKFSLRTGESLPLVKKSGGFAEPPNPFPGADIAKASPAELLGNYWLDSNSDAMIVFGGKAWNGMAETFRAHLVIDAESLEQVVETETVLGGRKLAKSDVVRLQVH